MHGWDVLIESGVPLGAARPRPTAPLDGNALQSALTEVRATLERSDTAEAVALLAWLSAFRHHWPLRFEALVGEVGERTLADLDAAVRDRNRYLKLRRIAVENLAGLV